MIYLDYASVGIPKPVVIQKVHSYVDQIASGIPRAGSRFTMEMVETWETARSTIADFYQVQPRNIAFIENTTAGLGHIATALKKQLQKGDKILVPDIDFISSALVWKQVINQTDCELHTIHTQNGHVPMDSLDKNVKVLCMSAVQEVSGDRFSFSELLKIREKTDNEYWIVDGIQEVGIFKRNLLSDKIDAYLAGGHKWLGSPFGLGFMYISDRLLEVLEPSFIGYFNLEEPAQGWEKYLESRERTLHDQFKIKQEASLLESGGMINALGAVALRESFLDWEYRGPEKVAAQVINHQRKLRQHVSSNRNFVILGDPSKEETWSGICTISHVDGILKEKELLGKLTENGIVTSLRSTVGVGGIRISTSDETKESEIESLLEML